MTARTYCVLNPTAAGDLIVDEGGLRVTTGGVSAGAQMALGNLAQASGTSSCEVYFWSVLRADLAGLISFGVAEPDCDTANVVGGDAAGKSWGYLPADGAVRNANADVSGSVLVVAERACLTLQLVLSPTLCTCAWLVNGSVVYTATLPNGKTWVPAISLGAVAGDEVAASINCGQNRFDQAVVTTGWYQQAPGLDALRLALATEGFLSAPADNPANTPYSPYILNASQISAKREPLPWYYRTGGSYNPASISSLKLRNDDGTFNALIGADVRDSPITLSIIDAPAGGAGSLATATPMLAGIIDKATSPDASTVSLTLRDSLAKYDVPLPCRIIPPFYDQASAGKIWPIGLGAQRNVQPLLLEGLTYALGDAPMSNIAQVSDMAAPLDPNALPPQDTPALDGAAVTLQTDPVGRVAVDCSSVGAQYSIPGAADVLAGIGKFSPWSATLLDITNTIPPDDWTWSGNTGSFLMKQTRPGDPTAFLARLKTTRPWYPSTPDYEGDYLATTGTPLIGGRSYRVTFKLPDVASNTALGNPLGSFYGGIKGGIMLRTALSANRADAITPHGKPISVALPYSQSYSYLFTVPPGPARKLYIMVVASSGATAATANGIAFADVCNVTLELLAQQTAIPVESISFKDAVTEILVNRFGADPSVFSAADCDAIDAAAGYGIGVRYEDQPNTLDALIEIADQFDAVVYSDSADAIRFGTLTANDDGPVVAALTTANVDLDSFQSFTEDAPGLTTNFGARRNWQPFGDSDFVTDTITVPAGLRAQYKGKSQFNVSATVPIAAEYAAARGAGRLHTLIDDRAACLLRGNRVCSLFSSKHVIRQFVAYYEDLLLGTGPQIAPQLVAFNQKLSLTIPEFGWVDERMTVIGWELFMDGRIILKVRH